ncbi:MAG TPA: hypothetical protein VIR29_03345 [Anseongella sp.]
MRQSITSTVEQRRDFTESFDTHPMEGAWAGEAIFFLTIEKLQGKDPIVQARVQISPDGVNWVDEGIAFSPMEETGLYFVRVRHFGGWLRLKGLVEGGSDAGGNPATANLTIHLVLKA